MTFRIILSKDDARVVELVDTQDLKSCVCMDVRVQVPPRVLNPTFKVGFFLLKTLVSWLPPLT
jgi:hypothetical protein